MDPEEDTRNEDLKEDEPSLLDQVISMSLQSAVIRTITSGLDVIKVNQQIKGNNTSFIEELGHLCQSPFQNFFKGNGTAFVRCIPYYYVRLLSLKWVLPALGDTHIHIVNILSDFISTSITHPLDTVKNQFTVGNYNQKSILLALSHMIRTHGFFSLWSGLTPALLAIGPYSLAYALREHLSYWLLPLFGNVPAHMALGISNCICQTMSIPFDLIKKRMQIDTRLTFIETITNVYQQEGLLGFFNGLVANHLKALVLPYLTKKFQDTRQTEFYKKNELYIFFFAMLIHEVIM